MVARFIESHAHRKASERATLHLIIARVDKPRVGILPDWITRTTDFLLGRRVSQRTGKSIVRGEPILAQPSPSALRKSVRRGDVPTEHWNIQAMLVSLTKELKLLIDLRLSLHRRGSHLDRAVDHILRANAE